MFLNKKRVKVEKILFPLIYMALYRTKIGLKLMDTISKKYPKLVGLFSFLSVIAGFLGMIIIIGLLVKGTFNFLFFGAPPPVAPLFPGVKTVPGLPVLSFFHWIIAIFILAGVHEFSHGLVSRLYNINVKSSGFAIFSFILPIIPAAFVEPDEKELASRKEREQFGVLAAGSFSNLLTAGVFFLLFVFIFAPIVSAITISEGVLIVKVADDGPSAIAGVNVNERIISINGNSINNVDDLSEQLVDLRENDLVLLETNTTKYEILAGAGDGKGYLGLSFYPEKQYIDDKYKLFGGILSWLTLLFFWIFAANLGVGLFNLLPMGPLDGGKMFYVLCMKIFKKENTAKKVWIGVSFFCLGLIVISLIPFFVRFISFIFGTLIGLF
ncbi:site-2 protease family protein [Candidatus Woesearchaeota archaeon]|nr:site-2 protease family protein [Candidatus Woesearchaeota archaeon]